MINANRSSEVSRPPRTLIGGSVKSHLEIIVDCGRMTGNPEVISSPVGLVPTNALVLIEPINSRMVNSEAPQKRRSGKRLPVTLHHHPGQTWHARRSTPYCLSSRFGSPNGCGVLRCFCVVRPEMMGNDRVLWAANPLRGRGTPVFPSAGLPL